MKLEIYKGVVPGKDEFFSFSESKVFDFLEQNNIHPDNFKYHIDTITIHDQKLNSNSNTEKINHIKKLYQPFQSVEIRKFINQLIGF